MHWAGHTCHSTGEGIRRNGAVRRSFFSSRRGAVLVTGCACLIFILIFTAWVTDLGFIYVQKARLQTAVDAATLGGTLDFSKGEKAVRDAIDDMLIRNSYDPARIPNLKVIPTFGTWDKKQHSFSTSSFAAADSIHVKVVDQSVPAFFGVIMGYKHYTVSADAVAGCGAPPRDFVLVVDCSGSMSTRMANSQSRMTNTKNAALQLVDALNKKDRLGLAVYSWKDPLRNLLSTTGKVEQKLNFNHNPIRNRIKTLDANEYTSRTCIGGGLRAGLDVYLNDNSPRPSDEGEEVERIMVLMTDGIVNEAEPYPVPNDGPLGLPPLPPFGKQLAQNVDMKLSVRKWANTIKARGIKLYVITLSDEAADPMMAEIASSPDEMADDYYYHVSDGSNDVIKLLDAFSQISKYGSKQKLLN